MCIILFTELNNVYSNEQWSLINFPTLTFNKIKANKNCKRFSQVQIEIYVNRMLIKSSRKNFTQIVL